MHHCESHGHEDEGHACAVEKRLSFLAKNPKLDRSIGEIEWSSAKSNLRKGKDENLKNPQITKSEKKNLKSQIQKKKPKLNPIPNVKPIIVAKLQENVDPRAAKTPQS